MYSSGSMPSGSASGVVSSSYFFSPNFFPPFLSFFVFPVNTYFLCFYFYWGFWVVVWVGSVLGCGVGFYWWLFGVGVKIFCL